MVDKLFITIGDRKSPGSRAPWDPLQMAVSWLINGGELLTTYPSPGNPFSKQSAQVGDRHRSSRVDELSQEKIPADSYEFHEILAV